MGARLPATTRANTSTSPQVAPARNNARAQALTVAPEVSTSSMSSSLRPTTSGPAGRWHTKGALHVLGSLGLIEPDLLRRRLDPFESPMCDHSAARIGYDMGQQCGLVEPPRPLATPMQRHRNERFGVGKELAAGASHPSPMVGARSSQSPYFKPWTSLRAISS